MGTVRSSISVPGSGSEAACRKLPTDTTDETLDSREWPDWNKEPNVTRSTGPDQTVDRPSYRVTAVNVD